MWVFTNEEADYLSRTFSNPSSAATRLSRIQQLQYLLPRLFRTWLQRDAMRAELNSLDERTLADLGINRGDFPRIVGGTFRRGGLER